MATAASGIAPTEANRRKSQQILIECHRLADDGTFVCRGFGLSSGAPWPCVLVCALFAGDHGANEIFAMNEAGQSNA